MEKLKISRSDFLNALENDIKPAFGTSGELLQMMLTRGIINWGSPVSHVLEDGMLLIQQVRNQLAILIELRYKYIIRFSQVLMLHKSNYSRPRALKPPDWSVFSWRVLRMLEKLHWLHN